MTAPRAVLPLFSRLLLSRLLLSRLLFVAPALVVAPGLMVSPPVAATSVLPAPATAVQVDVTGEGEVQAVPDQALVAAALSLQGPDSRALLAQADTTMAAVLRALRSAGVKEDAIQAGQVQLSQRWNYHEGQQQADGYDLRRPLSVRLDAIDRYPAILDLLSSTGMNVIEGVSFAFSRQQQLQEQATGLAVADAVRKAQLLGRALAQPDCRPLQLTLDGAQVPVPRLEMAAKQAMLADGPAYNPGAQPLSATVSARFACQP
jgi:uncharacterized protein YggE